MTASIVGLFAACAVGCGGAEGPTVAEEPACVSASVEYPAPTLTGATRDVHDPEIVREGDAFYVLSTNDGIPIRRSTDLRSWSFVGRVFPDQLPPWATGEVPGVQAPWAPGVGFWDGRYHLYYSLSTFGSPRSVIGLATNRTLDPSSPSYAWEDRGKVVESFDGDDFNAIDPAVVEDDDGGLWLTWGSWGGGIELRALDRATGMVSSEDTTVHALARRPVEKAEEGPYIVRRDGLYYLFVSFDLCCRGVQSTYNVRVGRAAAVTGPYIDRDGVPMLDGGGTLVLSGYGRVRGPGHASVLEIGGGSLLVHHFYDAEDGGAPHLQIRPLLWDADGWPLAGGPWDGGGVGPPPPDPVLAGRWGYWAGEEAPREVTFAADGRLTACDAEGRWSYAAPTLTVAWTSAGAGRGGRTDQAVLSADGDYLVGRAADGRIVRAYRLSSTDRTPAAILNQPPGMQEPRRNAERSPS